MALLKPNSLFPRIKRRDISLFTITLRRGWSLMAVFSNPLELHENTMTTFGLQKKQKWVIPSTKIIFGIEGRT